MYSFPCLPISLFCFFSFTIEGNKYIIKQLLVQVKYMKVWWERAEEARECGRAEGAGGWKREWVGGKKHQRERAGEHGGEGWKRR